MRKPNQRQFTFASECSCLRCEAPCKVNPIPGSTARMLKRADEPKGLCINCAMHDTLRYIYPINLIYARSGPKALRSPDIQRGVFEIVQLHGTDAVFEEIDWNAVIANWDLPFPTPIKRTATNPVTEEELAMARLEGQQRREGTWKEPLTEEEYEAHRQAAIEEFLVAAKKGRAKA